MTKANGKTPPRYQHSFALNNAYEAKYQACLSKFRQIDMIKKALDDFYGQLEKPPKKLIDKVKGLVK